MKSALILPQGREEGEKSLQVINVGKTAGFILA
jgi:hypothetical protein